MLYYTKLEGLARDKHSRLLGLSWVMKEMKFSAYGTSFVGSEIKHIKNYARKLEGLEQSKWSSVSEFFDN